MGAIGGLLGLGGGAAGSGFAGPSQANIQTPTTAQQATNAYNSNQSALSQQQSLLNAIQGQNGLGNQSSVYNQLQGITNGTGPNPAQAMLAQSTGQNTANQAALMAGQRGASSNVGLLARQAAQQGAANQQNAAGQAATLQANQSLNALGQQAGLANTMAANQIGATGANTQAQQAEQGQLLNAIQGQNANQVSMQSNINSANAGLANTTMQGQQSAIGGIMNSAGAAAGMAKGGMVKYADGGSVGPQSMFGQFVNNVGNVAAPGSSAPSFGSDSGADALKQGTSSAVKGAAKAIQGSPSTPYTDTQFTQPDMGSQFAGQAPSLGSAVNPAAASAGPSLGADLAFARGGAVPALLSGGEGYLPPSKVAKVKAGASPIKEAEKIRGPEIKKGDSLKNDVVPKTLEEGGIVLPKSVMEHKHPHWAAHKFVSAIMAEKGLKGKK